MYSLVSNYIRYVVTVFYSWTTAYTYILICILMCLIVSVYVINIGHKVFEVSVSESYIHTFYQLYVQVFILPLDVIVADQFVCIFLVVIDRVMIVIAPSICTLVSRAICHFNVVLCYLPVTSFCSRRLMSER